MEPKNRKDPFFLNTQRTFIEIDYEPGHTESHSKSTTGKNGPSLILASWVPYHNILISG